jgi:hypothetical protein
LQAHSGEVTLRDPASKEGAPQGGEPAGELLGLKALMMSAATIKFPASWRVWKGRGILAVAPDLGHGTGTVRRIMKRPALA